MPRAAGAGCRPPTPAPRARRATASAATRRATRATSGRSGGAGRLPATRPGNARGRHQATTAASSQTAATPTGRPDAVGDRRDRVREGEDGRCRRDEAEDGVPRNAPADRPGTEPRHARGARRTGEPEGRHETGGGKVGGGDYGMPRSRTSRGAAAGRAGRARSAATRPARQRLASEEPDTECDELAFVSKRVTLRSPFEPVARVRCGTRVASGIAVVLSSSGFAGDRTPYLSRARSEGAAACRRVPFFQRPVTGRRARTTRNRVSRSRVPRRSQNCGRV